MIINAPANQPVENLTWCLAALFVLLLGGCIGTEPQELPSRAQVWQCGNRVLETRSNKDWLRLELNGRARDLPRVVSASGEKYQDDSLLVWMKGEDALVEQFGRRWPACQLNRAESIWAQARADGMRFRGLGNEPGWVVEIWPDRIRYLGDYGTTEASWPRLPPQALADGVRYPLGPGHWLEIRDQACQDTMNGGDFDASVELQLGQRRLNGCGRNLIRGGALPGDGD